MTLNTVNLKKTLGKFATGITIVCIKKDGLIIGKTVNSFNSLSLKPPLVLFSLGIKSSRIKDFLKTKYLNINILSENQKKLSENFSLKKPKINLSDFSNTIRETPFIENCVANFECVLKETLKRGDHHLFICRVINIKRNDKLKPLYYFNSNYKK